MSELACPFCGSNNLDERVEEDADHVLCLDCKASGPGCDTWRIAVDAWNRRAPAANAPADPALLALAKLAAKLFDRAWIKSVGFVNEGGIQDDLDRDTVAFGLVRYEAPGDFQMAPGIADAIARLLAPDGAGEVAP